MQELIDQLIQTGLTSQQAEAAIQTIAEWLKIEYPVAGVLLVSWLKAKHSSAIS